jgi:hypothetical protein
MFSAGFTTRKGEQIKMDIKTAKQVKADILKFINDIEKKHRIVFRRIDTIATNRRLLEDAGSLSTDIDLVFRQAPKSTKTRSKKGSGQ